MTIKHPASCPDCVNESRTLPSWKRSTASRVSQRQADRITKMAGKAIRDYQPPDGPIVTTTYGSTMPGKSPISYSTYEHPNPSAESAW